MKKQFLIVFLTLIASNVFQAQTKGTKIGYIDMEYILQNVPDYTEAQNQLEQKAQKWKQEIETKKTEINKLKDALKAERALLTKGLIEERVAEIAFLENETLEYQQKRFGPNGDLMTQKAGLTKPIQDQVFTAVQDIAEAKKYDFIFDKTSDLTMLFAAKRFDISDQIIRVLNRAEKREQLTKKQLKEEAAREAKEDAIDDNPALQDRQKVLDAKKAARDKIIADRLTLQEERKQQILAEREAKRTGKPIAPKATPSGENIVEKESADTAAEGAKQKQLDARAKTLEDRKKVIEENKKAQEEKRKQILADREAKKTGTVSESTTKEETQKTQVNTEPINEVSKNSAEEAKQKQADARAKTIEERNKIIEERKKALEEKKRKILEEREAAKKAAEEKLKTTK